MSNTVEILGNSFTLPSDATPGTVLEIRVRGIVARFIGSTSGQWELEGSVEHLGSQIREIAAFHGERFDPDCLPEIVLDWIEECRPGVANVDEIRELLAKTRSNPEIEAKYLDMEYCKEADPDVERSRPYDLMGRRNHGSESAPGAALIRPMSSRPAHPRNCACPCGSGKKFKRCCRE